MVDVAQVVNLSEAGADAEKWPAVPRLENGWYPTGGEVDPAVNSGLMNWQARQLALRSETLRARVDDLALKAGSTVTVGNSGDFSTVNEALSYLSERRPGYVQGGFQTQILLLDGFTMAEQILVSGVNLGWISIVAEAAEVFIDRAYMNVPFHEGAAPIYPSFGVKDGGTLPRIDALFTMMDTGPTAGRMGINAFSGGFATVGGMCGIKNCGDTAVLLTTSASFAGNGSVFSGAGGDGASVAGGTQSTFQGADLSGAGDTGLRVSNGAVSHAWGLDASGAGQKGVHVYRGATLNLLGGKCRKGGSDSTQDIVCESGSIINATNATGGTSIAVNTVTPNGIIFK
ncbi:hypothetical protein SAMN04489858_101112 [Paracoccus homiensis]|uniref:Uncharacterized protein n=2 Tax=Paracoccus homiensis TaxID=364199 RepID=A0A1H9YDB5_9RHOB|nr:hypothetical protein SAMN04489858_101112 [Paracoccus homiensis]